MASLTIGPTGRTPTQALNEFQYAYIYLAQTAVIVPAGHGTLHAIVVGVAGTDLKLYDTPSGGTADATTQIATVSLAAVSYLLLDIAFTKGLTAVVAGAAEVTLSFRGTATVNPRTFGA